MRQEMYEPRSSHFTAGFLSNPAAQLEAVEHLADLRRSLIGLRTQVLERSQQRRDLVEALVVNEVAWLRSDPPEKLSAYWQENYPGIKTVPENLRLIPACGYQVIGHFALPEDAWWVDYYNPLEKRLQDLRKKYRDDPKALEVLGVEQAEIEMFREYSAWYGAVFFVMEKGEERLAIST